VTVPSQITATVATTHNRLQRPPSQPVNPLYMQRHILANIDRLLQDVRSALPSPRYNYVLTIVVVNAYYVIGTKRFYKRFYITNVC